jgi:hypothetical protein
MKIILKISEDKNIKLSLFGGKKELDSFAWKDENYLSHLLLANLDKLLTKNGLGVDKISGWQIMSEVPQKWTTYRIADITLKTLNIGLSASSVDKLAKKNRVC